MLSRGRTYLVAGYVVASVLGEVLAHHLRLTAGFSLWYLPAGFALGILVILGWRAAPLVLGTRLLGILVADGSVYRQHPGAVVAEAVVVVTVYSLAAEALRHIGLRHAHLRELGWFVAIGVIAAPLVSAAGVALCEIALGHHTAHHAFSAARVFWVGDAATIATFVPLILIVAHTIREGRIVERLPTSGWDRVDAAVQGIALVLVPVLVFATTSRDQVSPGLVLALLPAIWVAARRDLVLAAAGPVVVNSTVAIVGSRVLTAGASVIDLQVIMLSAAISADYVGVALRTRSDQRADQAERIERYEALVGGSPDLIIRFDRHAAVVDENRHDPVVSDHISRTFAAPDASAWEAPRAQQHDWTHGEGASLRWYRTRIGAERGLDGEPTTLLSITTDLTALRSMEQQVADSVAHDELTGLASQAALIEFCEQRQGAADRSVRLTLIVVDLDRFAQMRQSVSPDGADELLRLVGRLIVAASPTQALVARTGDQEFVVASLFPAATAVDDATALANLLLGVTHDADRRGRSDLLTASIGVVVADDSSAPARALLDDARLAVGAAKETGRDRAVVFDHRHRRAASDRRTMLDAIRRGLDNDEFKVLYQPELRIDDRQLVGVEALVRWERPHHGLLPPDDFLELAERNGLVAELGLQVLDQALVQLAAWTGAGADLTVGVNVSAQQLVSDQFVETVDDAMRRHGVEPGRVRLELTETSLLVDPAIAARTLAALRELGARIALDDFGAGYASIGYLRTLPLDVLKIDQSFVAGLPGAEGDLAIVRFVVGLADTLGLAVTAEGIEREEQAACLLELGCHHGQGFLFDRPVAADRIAERFHQPSHPGPSGW